MSFLSIYCVSTTYVVSTDDASITPQSLVRSKLVLANAKVASDLYFHFFTKGIQSSFDFTDCGTIDVPDAACR